MSGVNGWVEVFTHVQRATAHALYHGTDAERVLSYITSLERQIRLAESHVEGVNRVYEKACADLEEAKRAIPKSKMKARVAKLEEQVASLIREVGIVE